jgi:ABC-type amino acid transport substrate-binding protein
MAGNETNPSQRGRSHRLFWVACALTLLLPRLALAGELAAVKANGKLVLLCFANQDDVFVSANLDALRARHLTLSELHDPEGFQGIDVELLKGFAKRLGVKLEIHSLTTSYGDLIPALLHGEGDLIANELTITPKRRESVDFSAPYMIGWEVVVVRPDSKIASAADLKGKKCAVAPGTSLVESLKRIAPEVQLVTKEFPQATYVAVQEGEADCAMSENATPVGQTMKPPQLPLKVAFRVRQFEYGMAVRQGSDLLGPLNAYLEEQKRSGELARLARQFKAESFATPASPTKP